MMKRIVFLLLSIWAIQGFSYNADKGKIKVLIIDGQNNHSVWPKSTIMMKQYLEETNLFEVNIERTKYLNNSEEHKDWLPLAQVPAGIEGKSKTDPDFKPNFSNYDVVISNFGFKAAAWPKETQLNFENYIKNGGGFVSVHAADNCFPEWEAYNKIIGIGGWGNRTEKDGPYLYIDKDNKPKKDYTAGPGGKHGKKEAFLVTTYDKKHPIMRGIPQEWMHAEDECYAYMRGSAENVTILSTAVSTLKDSELQQKEPVVMTIEYGKGRIFHTTLGHDTAAFECVGFITLLERGVEWAATGKVKRAHTKLAPDFPTKINTSTRKFQYKK